MSRIIVVGAGHGGLVAAARLAKAGHSVCVLEKRRRQDLGYPWEDRFDFDAMAAALEMDVADFPADSWCYRSDSTFLSPDKGTHIDVHFDEDHRQKIMWRRPLIELLLDYASRCGAELRFETTVSAPIIKDDAVVGVVADGDLFADLVIDASGVMSVLRDQLPAQWGLQPPARGDVFYAHRAYYKRIDGYDTPAFPFEVYLVHEGEPGLSWVYTTNNAVDVLIGRIDPITQADVDRHLELFRTTHPWLGHDVVRGGQFAVIPVRRPLPRFVGKGYAAVGDSAYMTTPMNGMGIDLSVQAGLLLADTVAHYGVDINALWHYNRQYFLTSGAEAAKNEGLKNTLLAMPPHGLDRLYRCHVIEADNLAGGGTKMRLGQLLKKLINGLACPRYFFAILRGLAKGAINARLYRAAPVDYDPEAIRRWVEKIERNAIRI